MKGKRFSQKQMIAAINRHDAGDKVKDIARERGITVTLPPKTKP